MTGPLKYLDTARLDAVLRFLPLFEDPAYRFGSWSLGLGTLPSFDYRSEVYEFIGALKNADLVYEFDWRAWGDQARRYSAEPELLEEANLITLRKLFTYHVRADRFNEGHLAIAFQRGHINLLLRRLKAIRQGLESGEPDCA